MCVVVDGDFDFDFDAYPSLLPSDSRQRRQRQCGRAAGEMAEQQGGGVSLWVDGVDIVASAF